MRHYTTIDLGWVMGNFCDLFTEALAIAGLTNTKVSFDFNGVRVHITSESRLKEVWVDVKKAIRSEGKSPNVFGRGWG